MRTELHTRSKFDRALEALEELDRVLGLTVEQRVALELRLLESGRDDARGDWRRVRAS